MYVSAEIRTYLREVARHDAVAAIDALIIVVARDMKLAPERVTIPVRNAILADDQLRARCLRLLARLQHGEALL